MGKVVRVVVAPPDNAADLYSTVEDKIRERIAAGRRITRYNREWIVGRIDDDGGVLAGKIGFQGAEGVADVWDEEANDFKLVATPAGLTAPFALRLSDLRLVFQPRGGLIKVHSFTGAFEALLSTDNERWRIVGDRSQMTFEQWRASVETVVAVRFHLERPNPDYADARDLEAVMEQAEAEVVTLEAKNDHGINPDASFLQQSQAHIERRYGDSTWTGRKSSGGRDSVYRSRLQAEEVSEEAPADPNTGEVSTDTLRQTLAPSTERVETESDVDRPTAEPAGA